MKKIKEFLESHPLISYNSIGVALGLRDGQLRADRDIPKKYLIQVEKILMGYGYVPSEERVEEILHEVLDKPKLVAERKRQAQVLINTGEVIFEQGAMEICKDCIRAKAVLIKKTHSVKNGAIGILEGGLFKRVLLDDGDYYVEKL